MPALDSRSKLLDAIREIKSLRADLKEQSEDYQSLGRDYHVVQKEVISLREQLENCMFLVARIENERNTIALALETENQVATRYAQQMAYWIEKHDVVRKERDEMVVVLEAYLKWVEPLIKDIGMQDMERKARSALAKVGADKTGESK